MIEELNENQSFVNVMKIIMHSQIASENSPSWEFSLFFLNQFTSLIINIPIFKRNFMDFLGKKIGWKDSFFNDNNYHFHNHNQSNQ